MKTICSAGAAALAVVFLSACNVSKSPTAPNAAESSVAAAPSPAPTPTTAPQLSGPEVVAKVAATYPERLAGGVSFDQRVQNMSFLRDRIIEVGTCHGLLLARNTKMNGQTSIDAINWRHGADDRNDVVDIAFDYDNPDRPLDLHWHVTHGPAGWTPITVRCA